MSSLPVASSSSVNAAAVASAAASTVAQPVSIPTCAAVNPAARAAIDAYIADTSVPTSEIVFNNMAALSGINDRDIELVTMTMTIPVTKDAKADIPMAVKDKFVDAHLVGKGGTLTVEMTAKSDASTEHKLRVTALKATFTEPLQISNPTELSEAFSDMGGSTAAAMLLRAELMKSDEGKDELVLFLKMGRTKIEDVAPFDPLMLSSMLAKVTDTAKTLTPENAAALAATAAATPAGLDLAKMIKGMSDLFGEVQMTGTAKMHHVGVRTLPGGMIPIELSVKPTDASVQMSARFQAKAGGVSVPSLTVTASDASQLTMDADMTLAANNTFNVSGHVAGALTGAGPAKVRLPLPMFGAAASLWIGVAQVPTNFSMAFARAADGKMSMNGTVGAALEATGGKGVGQEMQLAGVRASALMQVEMKDSGAIDFTMEDCAMELDGVRFATTLSVLKAAAAQVPGLGAFAAQR